MARVAPKQRPVPRSESRDRARSAAIYVREGLLGIAGLRGISVIALRGVTLGSTGLILVSSGGALKAIGLGDAAQILVGALLVALVGVLQR